MSHVEPVIETHELRKSYGSHEALRGIDLRVERGTVFGLIGPNGSGKSTTLKLLLDLLRPSAGTVRVFGQDPRRAGSQLRRNLGYLPGELRLDGRLSGRRLLQHFARLSGAVDPAYMHGLAERFGVDLGRPIRALSKGNKQKIGLVQAFMHQPDLLILDEPTSGLDPLVQREFHTLLHEVCARGQTVLLSSHVLSEVQQVAQQVAVLGGGLIVGSGDVDALRLRAIRRVNAGIATADPLRTREQLRLMPELSGLEIHDDPVGVRITGTTRSDIRGFVRILSGLPLADLSLEEPDLEESVLHLYRERERERERRGGGDA
ncbi:ABC transporter ATP-binding protein [Leucobacter sp. W1153]|uniref:ABC transporter ATP-binding protein n=1 Tax=unclassified Leucobacter TaxID=2621730 RepID=UPI003F34357E